MENKKNKTLHWLYHVPGRHKGWVAVLCAFQTVLGCFGVLYALLLKRIVDSAVVGERQLFFRYTMLFLGLELGRIVLVSVNRHFTELARATLENRFKSHLFERILYGDYAKVTTTHSGEWMNRLTNDTVVVANGFVDILPGLLGMLVRLVSAMIMILFIDTFIALVMIPVGIVLAILTYLIRKKLKSMHKAIQETDGRLRIFMQESIESLMIIKAFGAEKHSLSGGESRMNEHRAARMRRNTFSVLANVGYLLTMNGMYIMGICYGGYGILVGTLSYGTLMAVSQLITQLQGPIVSITGLIPKVFTMSASAERLMEIEDPASSPKALSPEGSSASASSAADASSAASGAEAAASANDAAPVSSTTAASSAAGLYSSLDCLGLRNIDFTYFAPSTDGSELTKDKMPEVLKDFSLEIKKGEFIAFSGHSGCGKSTVLKLLMNMYTPDSGELYFRTAGAADAASDAPASASDASVAAPNGAASPAAAEHPLTAAERSLFAYVPQGNYLMSGTVREIVSFAEPDAAGDTARIQQALKVACADSFIDDKDLGVDSVLGERGSGLSEGQMQRIAIARALFADRPILLLDEATSGLDEATEKQLLHNLRTMTDKTVIIVTHRRAVMDACDRVVEFG